MKMHHNVAFPRIEFQPIPDPTPAGRVIPPSISRLNSINVIIRRSAWEQTQSVW